jgi:ribosomal protein S18 acetylase RimI-like enzyme
MTPDGRIASQPHCFIQADQPRHFAMAGILFREYAEQLGIDLCFQDFSSELNELADRYGPPSGCLWLVMRGSTAVGCGALRRLDDGACEMKRLYIRRAERGASLGRQVAERLVHSARALGYDRMLLDTLAEMAAARRLYLSLGFRETGPYYRNPLPNAVYMELDLRYAARDP